MPGVITSGQPRCSECNSFLPTRDDRTWTEEDTDIVDRHEGIVRHYLCLMTNCTVCNSNTALGCFTQDYDFVPW